MSQIKCSQCGASIESSARECKYCGEPIAHTHVSQHQPVPVAAVPAGAPQYNQSGIPANWPVKNKLVAAVLAIILGGLGIHRFYLGQMIGVVYIIFCFTGIPSLIGIIEGILMLMQSDHDFQMKYQCRLDTAIR